MNKTLWMTTLALAAIAAAATPSASACYSTNEVLTYAVCYVPGATLHFAGQEAADAVTFAQSETSDTVAFAQALAEEAPLP